MESVIKVGRQRQRWTDASCDYRDGCFVKTKKGKETVLVCFSLVAKPRVCFCRREVS